MADPPELNEDVALAVEHRRYVLQVFERLHGLNHYEVLGISRSADKVTIKRAYFDLARFVHPDRYFGKQLGSFKPKLDAIFSRVAEAYATLSAPADKAIYDAWLSDGVDQPVSTEAAPAVPVAKPRATPPAPAPAAPPKAPPKPSVLDALKKRVEDGRARAGKLAETAQRARAAGDMAAALEAYRAAVALAPNDAALKQAHDETAAIVAERRCEAHRRQAAMAERQGRWDQAAASWQFVADARPDDAQARAALANALARASGRPPR